MSPCLQQLYHFNVLGVQIPPRVEYDRTSLLVLWGSGGIANQIDVNAFVGTLRRYRGKLYYRELIRKYLKAQRWKEMKPHRQSLVSLIKARIMR